MYDDLAKLRFRPFFNLWSFLMMGNVGQN